MIVVEPFDIIGGLLTESNIPEPDAAAGEVVWSAYTSAVGDLRILTSTHLVYKAAAITTDAPDVGAAKAVPTWVIVGYTNRYRMFDQVNSSQSTKASPLTVEITSESGFDCAAIFNATGVTSVRYQVYSASGMLRYDKTLQAIDNSARNNWYSWLFEPIKQRYNFFVSDIPRAANQKIVVTISVSGTLNVGTLVIGKAVKLGTACYGTSFRYVNLTRVDENDFGDLVITPRRKYKLIDFDVRTEKDDLNFTVNQLSQLVDKPCVWSGTNATDDPTTVFGYYVDWQQNIDSPVKCTATFKIRELV